MFLLPLKLQEVIPGVSVMTLTETWKLAASYIGTAILTDACLMFMPSQIAFASWIMASQKTGFPFEQQYVFFTIFFRVAYGVRQIATKQKAKLIYIDR
jgi:hypothetical protein